MTTGRINQVTIVRRGWPTSAAEAALERFSLPVVARCDAGAAAGACLRLWAGGDARAILFPPLCSPGQTVHTHKTRCGLCGLGAPGGGLSEQRLPLRRQLPVVATCCSELR